MKIIIVLLLITNSAFAQNATVLEKGQTAPFSGILVKTQKMEELIKADKKVPLLEAKFDAQNELVDYHKGVAREARGKLLETELKGNVKGIYGFVLGVVTMSIAFKVSQEINR